ncbi:MAG: hypothetical protein AAFR56_19705 [Chloroflexota bacterium]
MLIIMLRSGFLLLATLTVCVGAVRAGYGLVVRPHPDAVYWHRGCDQPCWRNLHLNRTTEADLLSFVTDNGYDLRRHTANATRGADMRFADDRTEGFAMVRETMVYLSVTDDACPLHLLGSMGAPDTITLMRTRNADRTGWEQHFYMAYERDTFRLTVDDIQTDDRVRVVVSTPGTAFIPAASGQAMRWPDMVKMLHTVCG